MPEMPYLGQPPKKSPFGKVLAVAVAFGLAGGGMFWLGRKSASHSGDSTDPIAATPTLPAAGAVAVAPSEAGQEPLANVPVVPVPGAPAAVPGAPTAAAPAVPARSALETAGLRHVSVSIDGPVETAFVEAVGKELGAPLTQVVTRSLVWWVDVPGDLRRGDRVEVLFAPRPGEEPLVHAVRFTSGKLGKTVSAYRHTANGDKFARYFNASGEELEMRLQDAPLDEYEQITSLLKDGRRHKGVDFKTAVGTPVKAPFDGVITRKNWAFRSNGNSLEVQEVGGKGRRAMFLHLSELPKTVSVGQRVKRGQVLAMSGNTGRSFAPHLHYQLMGGGDRVLDPFEQHATYRRTLPETSRSALETEVRRLDGLFPTGTIAAGATP